jgi:3-deoxy-7-phosphoheptulonate synthase
VRVDVGFLVIAGPCSVETHEQICRIAKSVKTAGAGYLRGGAFKPRTSPYSFQGLGLAGIDMLVAAKEAVGLPIASEIVSPAHIDIFNEHIDIVQVGSRNMYNYDLLKELGRSTRKPILLKRAFSATIDEWIMAAEYLISGGNPNVILCERGIRTYEPACRNTLDISAIPAVKKFSRLPIIVDPSHAAGNTWMIKSLTLAAVAAGADGLMIEVHNDPKNSLCDAEQAITPQEFEMLMSDVRRVRAALETEEGTAAWKRENSK